MSPINCRAGAHYRHPSQKRRCESERFFQTASQVWQVRRCPSRDLVVCLEGVPDLLGQSFQSTPVLDQMIDGEIKPERWGLVSRNQELACYLLKVAQLLSFGRFTVLGDQLLEEVKMLHSTLAPNASVQLLATVLSYVGVPHHHRH